MAYWLLQCNPKLYRFADAVADGVPPDSWTVNRYLSEMAAGDRFGIWFTGPDRGVYALGEVTDTPFDRDGDADDPYWTDQEAAESSQRAVPIRLDRVLLDSPVLGSDLRLDPSFEDALIFRFPGGGNPFPLSEEQWQAIVDRAEPAPRRRNPAWVRDEVILALDLYLRHRPFLPGDDHPDVVDLSRVLNALPIHTTRPDLDKFRNPNGVALKLANLAALDPQYPGKGMTSGSRTDREVWDELADHPEQVRRLADLLREGAESGDLPPVPEPDEDEVEAEEGRLLYRLHRVRERSRALAKSLKSKAMAKGKLHCQVCGFDFKAAYGALGEGFIEAHHVVPLAAAGHGKVREKDLVLVCSNCHSMLHRKRPWASPQELQGLISKSKVSGTAGS